jgi:hypothetical protein
MNHYPKDPRLSENPRPPRRLKSVASGKHSRQNSREKPKLEKQKKISERPP